MPRIALSCLALFGLFLLEVVARPAPLLQAGSTVSPEQRKLLERVALPHARELAALPTIIEAVRQANLRSPRDLAGKSGAESMTNEKWRLQAVASPFVQAFAENPVSNALREKKRRFVSELFVSAASGIKVAFLEKTTYWDHAGKPKHELPMKNTFWIGELELDESTGVHQVQVSVPVLDQGKPIGSLVLGVAMSKLSQAVPGLSAQAVQ